MKILYYTWGENSRDDMLEGIEAAGHQAVLMDQPISNYGTDEAFEKALWEKLEETKYDCIFTFDFFPVISKVACRKGIRYLSWIYDCPHLTLTSKEISNEQNYVFAFDRTMCDAIRSFGGKHVFHLPLSVNTARMDRQLGKMTDNGNGRTLQGSERAPQEQRYVHEISFVGSLYTDNEYDRINYLPDRVKGYLEGLMAAQEKVWGCSFAEELLTEDVLKELNRYVKIGLSEDYCFTEKDIFCSMLEKKVTNRDRMRLLSLLAEYFPVDLYTGPGEKIPEGVKNRGYAEYMYRMPEIFRNSKINLNISLRSIVSGMPLRAVDILGAGGFLLSNYQPELAEFFVPDEDFVYFESDEDLLGKVEYYLSHEKERQEIAMNGWKKVRNGFHYTDRIRQMLELAGDQSSAGSM